MEEVKPHGWKTYLAAAVAIGGGILAFANGDTKLGFEGVVSGLALIGVRGALAKLIETLQGRISR